MTEPLYKALASQLTDLINQGHYPVGGFLPKELDMCSQFQVSRQTVRSAIAILEQQGLISRKKRAGTRIESTGLDRAYSYDLNSINDLIYLAESHLRKILSRQDLIVDQALHLQYGLPMGEHYIALDTLRLNAQPDPGVFSYTKLFFPQVHENLIARFDQYPHKLIALILEEFSNTPISHIQQSLQCISVDSTAQHFLDLKQGDTRLCITRKYFTAAEELLLMSYSIHQDPHFSYSIDLVKK
jgi:GntR family transcriptional regulator